MNHRKRKHRLAITVPVVVATVAAAFTAVIVTAPDADAATGPAWPIDTWGTPRSDDNVVLKWNEQLLDTIRTNPRATGPTVAARALGVVNTAMYDAWAAYDGVGDDPELIAAIPTQRPAGWKRQPDAERTQPNKAKAISFAAYKTLNWLFPDESYHRKAAYDAQMAALKYATYGDTSTAATVGGDAAQAIMNFRDKDKSNQAGSYADTTDYMTTVTNTWDTVAQPWHWQPLCVLTQAGVDAQAKPTPSSGTCPAPNYTIQKPLTPQWPDVTPFNVRDTNPTTHLPYQFNGSAFNPPTLANGSYDPADIDQALRDTSSLTDAQKAMAEYWADGPGSEFPPGHMAVFAQALSRMRGNTLDQDVKLFFALGNALMDASISAWGVKYDIDFWRPITAIRYRYKDKKVNSWLGPNKGYGNVLGQNWQPYQALNVVTPAFPEYVSGHSTFSAAGRTVLISFFGTDTFNAKVTFKARNSKFESTTPAKDVVLSWSTLTAASDQAGMSRRYGGIHFKSGDEHGRSLGRVIGYNDYNLAQKYIDGTFITGVDDQYDERIVR